MSAAKNKGRLAHLRVVLVEPQGALNMGLSARLCGNFEVGSLALVQPELARVEEARAYATGGSAGILDAAATRAHESLASAVDDCVRVIGFCGKDVSDPAPEWISLAELARDLNERRDMPVALVFGNERTGLRSEHIERCTHVCRIETSDELSSLNLSSAVAIALFKIHEVSTTVDLRAPAEHGSRPPEIATRSEVEALLAHAYTMLQALGYGGARGPSLRMLATLRRLLDRAVLRPHEARALRSLVGRILGRP